MLTARIKWLLSITDPLMVFLRTLPRLLGVDGLSEMSSRVGVVGKKRIWRRCGARVGSERERLWVDRK